MTSEKLNKLNFKLSFQDQRIQSPINLQEINSYNNFNSPAKDSHCLSEHLCLFTSAAFVHIAGLQNLLVKESKWSWISLV